MWSTEPSIAGEKKKLRFENRPLAVKSRVVKEDSGRIKQRLIKMEALGSFM